MTEKVLQGSGLNVSSATEEDWAEIVRLQQQTYPRHGWSWDYLLWQYAKNPAGKAQVWVAKNGERVVACCAAVPHRVRMKGQRRMAWRLEHLLAQPDARAQGFFYRFSRLSQNLASLPDFAYAFAFPNDRSYPGFIAVGWKAIRTIPLYILREKDFPQDLRFPSTPAPEPVACFEAEAASAWETYAKQFDVTLERSAEYLNWRYFGAPHVRYPVFKYAQNGGEAYSILKIYEDPRGGRWLHLCDYFERSCQGSLAGRAVGHALLFARDNGCSGVSLWGLPDSPLLRVLQDYGFCLESSWKRSFVVFPAKDEKQPVLPDHPEDRWQVVMGDSDVF